MATRRIKLTRRFAAFLCIWLAGPALSVDLSFSVAGGDEAVEEALEGASLLSSAVREDRTTPQDLVATARAEYSALLGVLYAKGYYGPTINVRLDGQEAADISPFGAPGAVRTIVIQVDPGPRFRFGTARIAPLAPGTDIPPGYASGEVAESGVIGDAAQAGVDGWRAVGHAKARLGSQSITANHPNRTLSADLRLDPGRRLRFGELRITGNRRTKTERIREIAGLPTGKVFSPDDVETAAQRLRRTEAFRSVALTEGEPVGDT
ncbi:MAG: POTRA domain-containing protein, partial [Pseudomonadota bacterium]